MEVGPLARLLVGYASGRDEVKEVVDGALDKLDVPVAALFSTLGRTAARGLETKLIAALGEGVLRPAPRPTSRTATRACPTARSGSPRPGRPRPGASG